jgi:enoyl-CoA hydratase
MAEFPRTALPQAGEGEDRRARDSMRSAEIKEGMRAFAEKRPPKF